MMKKLSPTHVKYNEILKSYQVLFWPLYDGVKSKNNKFYLLVATLLRLAGNFSSLKLWKMHWTPFGDLLSGALRDKTDGFWLVPSF